MRQNVDFEFLNITLSVAPLFVLRKVNPTKQSISDETLSGYVEIFMMKTWTLQYEGSLLKFPVFE